MRTIAWGEQITFPTISAGPFVSLAAPLTIAIWVWQNFFGTGGHLIQEWFRLGSERCVLRYNYASGSNNAEFYVKNADATVTELIGGTLTARKWVHICGTYDLSTMRLYINGTQVATLANTKASASASSDYAFFGSAAEQFDGALAEAGIWSAVLTTDEVSALAAGAKPSAVRLGNLVFYVPFATAEHDAAYIQEAELSGTGAAVYPPAIPRRGDGYGSSPVDWAPGAFLGVPPT